MLYIDSSRDIDPSFIIPNLQVSTATVDVSLPLTNYWPSYSAFSPDARKAYLIWLSEGENRPAPISAMSFCSFTALSAVFCWMPHPNRSAQSCRPFAMKFNDCSICMAIADHSGAMPRSYCRTCLHKCNRQVLPSPPTPITNRGYELPLDLRIGLGQLTVTKSLYLRTGR